jgi:hypothetical protein
MSSLGTDEQHRSAVAFWRRVAQAWVQPAGPEEREKITRLAEGAVQRALGEVRQQDTRKRVGSLLEDLLSDDED